MKNIKNKGLIGLFILLLGGGGTYVATDVLGGTGGGQHLEKNCSMQTTTAVDVGNQVSTQVLATSTGLGRAWARIETLEALAAGDTVGTSTIFVNLDGGNAATVNNGLRLTASSSDNFIDFGKATDLPYSGAVTAITPTASTSVLVTECIYTN